MKTIYKYTLLFIAALLMAPAALFADGDTGLILSKKAKDNLNGTYTLTIETYVTGQQITKMTSKPMDVVLVLDRSTSMWKDMSGNTASSYNDMRAKALVDGVSSFMNVLYSSATTKDGEAVNPADYIQHNIAVLTFYGGGDNTVTVDLGESNDISGGWKPITGNNVVSNINTNVAYWFGKDAVPNNTKTSPFYANPTNGTPALKGLYLANQLFQSESVKDNGHGKVVIFFTDGNCGYGSSWGNKPRQTAKQVINYANDMKDAGIRIFAIGAFGSNSGDDTKFYMNRVSSRYNVDVTQTNNWDSFTGVSNYNQEPDNENVFLSSNSSELKAAFEAVASQVKEETTAYELDGESTVVLDVLANKFSLPSGFNKSSIKLYTCSINTSNTNYNKVAWKNTGDGITVYKDANNEVLAQNVTSYSGTYDHTEKWIQLANTDDMISFGKDAEGSDEVMVTGYDYSSHFVGVNKDASGTITGWNANGQKLIIQFDIDVDPAHEGGTSVETNKSTSGVYTVQKDKDGNPITDPTTGKPVLEDDPVGNYEQPVVHLPYIKISLKGLKKGESGIFKITKVDKDGNVDTSVPYTATVVVTQAVEPTDTSEDPYAIVKLVFQGYYKVEEVSWTWAYDKEDAEGKKNEQTKQLLTVKDSEWSDADKFLNFVFGDEMNDSGKANEHAESYVPNNMSEDRAIGDPKSGSTGGGATDDDEGGNEGEGDM